VPEWSDCRNERANRAAIVGAEQLPETGVTRDVGFVREIRVDQ